MMMNIRSDDSTYVRYTYRQAGKAVSLCSLYSILVGGVYVHSTYFASTVPDHAPEIPFFGAH
jgi:hypothetical protein